MEWFLKHIYFTALCKAPYGPCSTSWQLWDEKYSCNKRAVLWFALWSLHLKISSKIFDFVWRGLFSLSRVPNHSCEITKALTTVLSTFFCKVKILVLVKYKVIIQGKLTFCVFLRFLVSILLCSLTLDMSFVELILKLFYQSWCDPSR